MYFDVAVQFDADEGMQLARMSSGAPDRQHTSGVSPDPVSTVKQCGCMPETGQVAQQLSSAAGANLVLTHQPVSPLLLEEHNIPWCLPTGQVQCLAIAVAPAGRCRSACQNRQDCPA